MNRDVRYQIFISSTFNDLENERKDVIKSLSSSDIFRPEWKCSHLPMKNSLNTSRSRSINPIS
ncbi:MAG: DUF4062 domain-containing protein [Candidatus Methanomethylophilaceae archaeon]|nr:DUF4062 domain-containing protein [Candidatus Methanomethylophilaceae archaeon]